jgi:hypothetical protein
MYVKCCTGKNYSIELVVYIAAIYFADIGTKEYWTQNRISVISYSIDKNLLVYFQNEKYSHRKAKNCSNLFKIIKISKHFRNIYRQNSVYNVKLQLK